MPEVQRSPIGEPLGQSYVPVGYRHGLDLPRQTSASEYPVISNPIRRGGLGSVIHRAAWQAMIQ